MLGALLQMLPVVLAIPVPAVRLVGWFGPFTEYWHAQSGAWFPVCEPPGSMPGYGSHGLIPFSTLLSCRLDQNRRASGCSHWARLCWRWSSRCCSASCWPALLPVCGCLGDHRTGTAPYCRPGADRLVLIPIIGVAYQAVLMLQITRSLSALGRRIGLTLILFRFVVDFRGVTQVESMAALTHLAPCC